MLLSELQVNESGFILGNVNDNEISHRIEELGLIKGTKVTLLQKSPFEDFFIFNVLDCQIALKKKEAEKIFISKTAPARTCGKCSFCKSFCYEKSKGEKKISVAIVGNSSSGKTSLFNFFTGTNKHSEGHSHSHSNEKKGKIENFKGYQIEIWECPGIYSLQNLEEEIEKKLLDKNLDLIINVVNSNAIERNLLLTLDLLSLGKPVIIALNMFDEFESQKSFIDIKKLSEQLHCKVFPTAFKYNRGTKEILENLIVTSETEQKHVVLDMEENISAEKKLCFIQDLLSFCDFKKGNVVKNNRVAKIFDKIVTNNFSCYFVFALIMFSFFKITFEVGEYCMNFINPLIDFLSCQVNKISINFMFKSLIIDGIFPAVCTLLTFLPQIVVLFFSLSLIEDSGYMSRIILIMDKIMGKFGLHGKAFISIMAGFGCNVPAIMATRNIDNKKSRLITILTISLISCSGLMPSYTYIINHSFDKRYRFLILSGIYLLTIVLLLVVSSLFNFFLKGDKKKNFALDLHPYRLPSLGLLLKNSFHKSIDFFKSIMTTVTFMSCIVWGLSYFPRQDNVSFQEKISNSYIAQIGKSIEPIFKIQNFDWKLNSVLLMGVSHKELIVSSLSVLNKGNDKIKPEIALPFLIFISLYCPCIATLIVIARELTWFWSIFTLLYTTGIAWIFSALAAWWLK
ncbi:MAG: fused ferrous iron transport protein A/B [Cytophagales bacterium]|jgi:ferrous iron transport protein B|nr:fused ferrous iron transport protein A/B [Cytophagales bacterium]